MKKSKEVYIYEEFVTITDDIIEATILSEMFVWSNQKYNMSELIVEEKNVYAQPCHGIASFQSGWISKKAERMKKDILCSHSEKTVLRRALSLVNKGFLFRRQSPEAPYDRTYEYRLNITAVRAAFESHGFNNIDKFLEWS